MPTGRSAALSAVWLRTFSGSAGPPKALDSASAFYFRDMADGCFTKWGVYSERIADSCGTISQACCQGQPDAQLL
jgi:hypothetical protein